MEENIPDPRIVAVHLLNDLSGSPFVFSQSLQVMIDNGLEVHLLTATPSGTGFLSGLDVVYHSVFYRWSKNRLLTLFYFIISQIYMFFRVLALCKRNDLLYVNTMLPFGAAIAGSLRGCKVVYHIHEVSVRPAVLKRFLLFVIRQTADYCIYVSRYVMENTKVNVPGEVIYNSLPEKFIHTAGRNVTGKPLKFTLLMLCSLKKYKGVDQFVQCAARLPSFQFELVLNAAQPAIDSYFKNLEIPPNLQIFPAQSDVHPFYSRASVVLNLSQPGEWIETFGMTALEAMNYGKPVIVPAAGGIMELVRDAVTGFTVNPSNVNEITDRIEHIAGDQLLYEKMGEAASGRASRFTPEIFRVEINHLLLTLTGWHSHAAFSKT